MAEDQVQAAARAEKAGGESPAAKRAGGARPGGGRSPGGNRGPGGRGGPGGNRGRGPGGRGGPGGNRGRGRGGRSDYNSTPVEFETKTVSLDRVSRMQAGGRRFRFRAVVITGNRKGVVGIGVGKAPDVRKSIEKATRRANENKVTVPRVKGTIPREIEVKLGTSRIIMRPARPGHGVVAGGVVRTICELAGITDISTKILSRSSNNLANARAVMAGLEQLATRVAIARERIATKGKGQRVTQKTESEESTEAPVA